MPRRPQKALSSTLAPLQPVEACHGASAAPAPPACSATRHARLRRALSSSTSRVQRASEAVGNRLKPGVQRIRSWQAVPSEVAQTIHEQRSAGANPLVAAHVAAQQQLAKLGKHPGLPMFLLLASATSICSGTLSLARCVVTFVTRRVPFLGRPITRVLHLAVPGPLLMPLAAAYVAMAALQGFQQQEQQQQEQQGQQCSSRRSPFSAPAAPRGASGRLVMVRKPSYSSLEEQRSSSSGSGSNRSSTSSEDPRQPRMAIGIITSPMRSPARPYTPDVRPAAPAPAPAPAPPAAAATAAAAAAAAACVAASGAMASGERAGPPAAADTAPVGAAAIKANQEAVSGPPSRARSSLELPEDTPECLVPLSDTAAPVTSAGGAGAPVMSTGDAAAPGATAAGPSTPPSAATQHATPLSDTAAPVAPPGDAAGPPASPSDTAALRVLPKHTAAAVVPPGDTTQLPVSCSDTAAPDTPRKDTPGLMTAASDMAQGLPSSSNAAAEPCVSITDTNTLAMAAPEVAAEVVVVSTKAVQPPGHVMKGTSAKAPTPVDLALALLDGPGAAAAAAAAAAAREDGGTAEAAARAAAGGETGATGPAAGVAAAPPGSWHVETYVPHTVTPLDALAPTEITRKRSSTAATCEQVVSRELQHNALQVEAAAELPPVVARVSSGRGVCRITAAAAAKQALAASQAAAAAAAAAASAAAAGAGPVSTSGQAEGAPVGIHLVRFGSGSRTSSQGWESGSSTPSIALSPTNSLGLPSSSGGPTAGGRSSHLLSPTYRSPRVSDDNMPPRGVAVATAAGQGPAVTAGYPAAAAPAAAAVAAAKVAVPASRPAAATAGTGFSQGLPTAAPAQADGPGSPSASGTKQALPTAAPQPPRPAVAAVVAALEQQQRQLAQRRQLEALSRASFGRSSLPLKPAELEAAPASPVLARTSSSGGAWQGLVDAPASPSGVKETGSAPPASISHITERREGVQFTGSNPLAAAAAARVRLSSS